jgi:hypothetical protein
MFSNSQMKMGEDGGRAGMPTSFRIEYKNQCFLKKSCCTSVKLHQLEEM